MGQGESKQEDSSTITIETLRMDTPKRRQKKARLNSRNIDVKSFRGLDSNMNIDKLLSNMGIASSTVKNDDSESDEEEILQMDSANNRRELVQELYDQRINRYKARFSVLFPEHSETGVIRLSRFRASSMMEILSFVDMKTRLDMKYMNRYFRKLISISHNEVCLNTNEGWVGIIKRSSFLKHIKLYREPKERELKEFCLLLSNDGFVELEKIEFYHIGEWALLEVIDALSLRVNRLKRLKMLDSITCVDVTIQDTQFSPYFAKHFGDACNKGLHHMLRGIRLIVKDGDGVEELLRCIHLKQCSALISLDLSQIPLSRHGYEVLSKSLWFNALYDDGIIPHLQRMILAECGITDSCMASLSQAIEAGYLSNLTVLDLSSNSITNKGFSSITSAVKSFLCPNLHHIIMNNNTQLGGEGTTEWFLTLATGVCSVLESVQMNNCGLSSSSIDALCVYLSSTSAESLHEIDIGNNIGITVSLSQLFQCILHSSSHLSLLNIEGLHIGTNVIQDLCLWLESPNSSTLQYLYLNNNSINDECLYAIFHSFIHSSIQCLHRLDISSNLVAELKKEAWDHMIYLDHCDARKHVLCDLDVSHNPCTDEDFYWIKSYLKRFIDMKEYKSMSIEDCNVTAKGVTDFFVCFPYDLICSIQKFSVTSISITGIGEGLNSWLCSPAVKNLKKLVLVDCCLASMDLTFLLHALEVSEYCQNLTVLRLSGNFDIDDDFVRDFVRIYSIEGRLPLLYDLDLMYTGVTKIGAYKLLEFFQTHDQYSLRKLNLGYTKLSAHRIGILFDEYKKIFKGGCMF